MKIKRNWFIVIGLLIIYFIFEISVWIATDGFPSIVEQTESYSTYRIGKNYFDQGIINLKFVDDCTINPSDEAHPYYYTHQPNFPNYFSYILIALGIHSMPSQILVMILIFGLALFYMYLTVKEYTKSEQLALLILAISVFSYASVIAFGLNIIRGWTWFVIFAPLYHFKKYASNKSKVHFLIGLIFYFSTMYYDYVIALYFTLVFLLLKIFGFFEELSWKVIIKYMILGTIPPFLLHKLFLIWAIGLDTFIQDFMLTISNRVLGGSAWDDIETQSFYASKGIVYSRGVSAGQNISNMINPVIRDLSHLFGKINFFIPVILFLFSGIILLLKRVKNSITFKFFQIDNLELIKFFMVFFAPMILFAFIKYIVGYFFHGLVLPLVVFPVTIGFGVFLSLLLSNLSISIKAQSKTRFIISSIIVILVVGQFFYTQYIHLTKSFPVKSMPGYEVLPKYRNRSFSTNLPASYIYYFTNQWVKSLWSPLSAHDYDVHEFIENTDFMLARDAFTNKEKYKQPDFLFIGDLGLFPKITNPEKTFIEYSLVEKGQDFWIFDLRKKNMSINKKQKMSLFLPGGNYE